MSSPSEMASFGHSGSQAPQLMQSWVIFVAMGSGIFAVEIGGSVGVLEASYGGVNRYRLFGCFSAQIVRQRGKVAPPMNDRRTLGFLAAALMLIASGCSPDIGASCTTSINCSQMGDRACDTSMPGGYCTIFNCEPDTCPSESACIAFRQWPSAIVACQDPNDTRMLRTFCMFRCSSNSDCRTGYICADVNVPGNTWGASLTDIGNRDGRICIVPGAVPQSPNQPDGYCQAIPHDSGVLSPYDAGILSSVVQPVVDASANSGDASADASTSSGQ